MTTASVQYLDPVTAVPLARAAEELVRAATQLGPSGAMLFGSHDERNVDHPDFLPILEIAADLRSKSSAPISARLTARRSPAATGNTSALAFDGDEGFHHVVHIHRETAAAMSVDRSVENGYSANEFARMRTTDDYTDRMVVT